MQSDHMATEGLYTAPLGSDPHWDIKIHNLLGLVLGHDLDSSFHRIDYTDNVAES